MRKIWSQKVENINLQSDCKKVIISKLNESWSPEQIIRKIISRNAML